VDSSELRTFFEDMTGVEITEVQRTAIGLQVKCDSQEGAKALASLDRLEIGDQQVRLTRQYPQMSGEDIFNFVQDRLELLERYGVRKQENRDYSKRRRTPTRQEHQSEYCSRNREKDDRSRYRGSSNHSMQHNQYQRSNSKGNNRGSGKYYNSNGRNARYTPQIRDSFEGAPDRNSYSNSRTAGYETDARVQKIDQNNEKKAAFQSKSNSKGNAKGSPQGGNNNKQETTQKNSGGRGKMIRLKSRRLRY